MSDIRERIAQALWEWEHDPDIDGHDWDMARHEPEGRRLLDVAGWVSREVLGVIEPTPNHVSEMLGIDYGDSGQRAAAIMYAANNAVMEELRRARRRQCMSEHDLAGELCVTADEAMEYEQGEHLHEFMRHCLAAGLTIVPVPVEAWEVER